MPKMKVTQKQLTKYLANYAEPEVDLLASFSTLCQSRYVLTIPAYKESDEFLKRFIRQFRQISVTLVVVINQPVSEVLSEPQDELRSSIATSATLVESNQHIGFYEVQESQIKILTILRYNDHLKIPDKQGVGLARKIAADCAVQLIQDGIVTVPWIGSTDADSILPDDYFLSFENIVAVKAEPIATAALFDFRHISPSEDEIYDGTRLYEQRLNYYVAGLKYADSPYAFHTIGSCLSFSAVAYCQARGFPKKSAGEDFYLLNKLAKLGPVKQLQEVIQIQSRLSDRVPFGTGPAVADILNNKMKGESYHVYEPLIFSELKTLLKAFAQLTLDEDAITQFGAGLSKLSCEYLHTSDFKDNLARWCSQYKTQQQLHKAINDWFDAFRTMKFVHFLRDNGYPNVELTRALDAAQQWPN